ncbi:hypothetical protein C1645_731385 [Glomus cerebriforme]|uniref:HMG box domain-containing protein n=1 Tax=Glomus cerebriforme TaxID=658196 RepID=A0A397TVB1_9GLOM|nr:hypothetical protein C1645_731385 [Glomus cerebriforme]
MLSEGSSIDDGATVSPDHNIPTPLTDEELVFGSNYPFNMDINVLLTNSTKCRRFKRIMKSGTENRPKPLNSFFIYMRTKISQPEYNNMEAKKRLKHIGDLWKHESRETKNLFEACARLAKKINDEQYQRTTNHEENGLSSPQNFLASSPSLLPNNPDIYSSSPIYSQATPFNSPNTSLPVTSSSSFDESLLLQHASNTESGSNNMQQYVDYDFNEFNLELDQLDLIELSNNLGLSGAFSHVPNYSFVPTTTTPDYPSVASYQYANYDLFDQTNSAQQYSNYLEPSTSLALDHNFHNFENTHEPENFELDNTENGANPQLFGQQYKYIILTIPVKIQDWNLQNTY